MTQVKITKTGDLRFIFKKINDDDIITVQQLTNGAQFEFVNNDCVALELLNFEHQLNRGKIDSIELLDIKLEDTDFVFNVVVDGQKVQGKVDLSSLK